MSASAFSVAWTMTDSELEAFRRWFDGAGSIQVARIVEASAEQGLGKSDDLPIVQHHATEVWIGLPALDGLKVTDAVGQKERDDTHPPITINGRPVQQHRGWFWRRIHPFLHLFAR